MAKSERPLLEDNTEQCDHVIYVRTLAGWHQNKPYPPIDNVLEGLIWETCWNDI